MLELRDVSHRYGDTLAVDQVDLTVANGEFFTLLGPSGCGKTTLLRLIAGFEQPSKGRILLDGEDLAAVPPERRPVHTVFQSYALFPHMTVAENVAFPLRMARVPEAGIRERVQEQLAAVRLEGMAGRLPAALSGGQRQRVALARALVNRPRMLLLDEPLAALDLKLREQLQLELIRLQGSLGITFIYVTHDQGEALALSHRVGVMNHGRLVQVDPPAVLYERPRDRFVAGFIGQCNLLEAQVSGQANGQLTLRIEGLPPVSVPAETAAAGERGTLALRPEHIRLGPAEAGEQELAGRIREHLFLGAASLYQVELVNGMRLDVQVASRPGEAALDLGAPVRLSWSLQAGRFLRD
jgi:spermidine/putrescine transport system ATP-binding protein